MKTFCPPLKIVLFLALLTALCLDSVGAEPAYDRLKKVTHSVEGGRLRLVLQTEHRFPEASVYFTSRPEHLIIELNDTVPGTKLSSRPPVKAIRSWSLKAKGLNRTRLSLALKDRPWSSRVEVTTQSNPPRLTVEVPLRSRRQEKTLLTEGLTWLREDKILAGRWTRINQLLFDPKDPNIEVVLGLAKEKTTAREKLTTMVRRYDAVAGINGGFFAGSGGALGLIFREGRLLAPHVSRRPPRSGFGLTKTGQALFGRLAADGPKIKDLDGGDWSQAWLALGGGPRLLKNGSTKITADLEELGPKGNDITRVAARTVVGQKVDGSLLFATVTGQRDNHSQGTQFEPLVSWLKSENIRDAVNFDGGASVNMVIGDKSVSDGPANSSKEKPVATALLIRDQRKKVFPNTAQWDIETKVLPADGTSQCEIEVSLFTLSREAVPDGTPVRLYASGAFISPTLLETKNGKVKATLTSARRSGRVGIELSSGPLRDKKVLRLKGGAFERLAVKQAQGRRLEDDELFQSALFTLQSLDQWGNPVPSSVFSCRVDGDAPIDFTTDRQGFMELEVEVPRTGGSLSILGPNGKKQDYTIDALLGY